MIEKMFNFLKRTPGNSKIEEGGGGVPPGPSVLVRKKTEEEMLSESFERNSPPIEQEYPKVLEQQSDWEEKLRKVGGVVPRIKEQLTQAEGHAFMTYENTSPMIQFYVRYFMPISGEPAFSKEDILKALLEEIQEKGLTDFFQIELKKVKKRLEQKIKNGEIRHMRESDKLTTDQIFKK